MGMNYTHSQQGKQAFEIGTGIKVPTQQRQEEFILYTV
jgi:hypothetical protein